jgi:16S rRNA (guanine527-N7)-methyltransferase
MNDLEDVSRETKNKLQLFKEELIKWNSKVNLVGRNELDQLDERHIKDCIQVSNYLPNKEALIVDLGSGAGFPGVVLSIKGYNIDLVEIDQKKILFLETVKNKLSLTCNIINQRIEKLSPIIKYDVVTARALADISKILEYSMKLIHNESRLLLLKGNKVDSEINKAKKNWAFEYTKIPSETNSDSFLIEIKNIRKNDV